MRRMLLLLPFLAACGGGGAQTSAETARVAACQAVEDRIERTSDLTAEQKLSELQCVRLVCDEIYERLNNE